jgi:hypothetical protein
VIFIHWGLYSVPAFGNEGYPRNMYKADTPEFRHHVATYGPQAQFGYKDFIPRFTAEKYDPAAWAELFRRAGARFVVPVAEHHDGFPMYDTALSGWSAAKMGPKRDLIGDLARAVRGKGLVFGLSTHRAEHWWFLDQGMAFDSDVRTKKWHDFYGPARPEKTPDGQPNQPDRSTSTTGWHGRSSSWEKYRPQLVWFDWWIEQPAFAPYLRRFAAYYYNQGAGRGTGVAINYKNAAFPDGAAVLDVERGQLAAIRPFFWQTDTSISKNSWGYVKAQDSRPPIPSSTTSSTSSRRVPASSTSDPAGRDDRRRSAHPPEIVLARDERRGDHDTRPGRFAGADPVVEALHRHERAAFTGEASLRRRRDATTPSPGPRRPPVVDPRPRGERALRRHLGRPRAPRAKDWGRERPRGRLPALPPGEHATPSDRHAAVGRPLPERATIPSPRGAATPCRRS